MRETETMEIIAKLCVCAYIYTSTSLLILVGVHPVRMFAMIYEPSTKPNKRRSDKSY
jgi:hypothetical protein